MSSAERYRQHAKECLDIAQSSRDEEDRAVWINLAQAWARLAQHDEGHDFHNWEWAGSHHRSPDRPH